MSVVSLKKTLRTFADPKKAEVLKGFFKTGKGYYGEGDIFIGVTVPHTRSVAKEYRKLSLAEVKKVLYSKIHEERLCAVLMLVDKFQKADVHEKKEIFNFYIKHIKQINNWDLVDLSAPKIVGEYLLDKPKGILYKFARSHNLWEKRVSIISTFTFIRNDQYKDTLKIAEILMNDTHDLIHKAVGWMLRELGKRSVGTEKIFLKKFKTKMPRTMLRYAIERFPEKERKMYLRG